MKKILLVIGFWVFPIESYSQDTIFSIAWSSQTFTFEDIDTSNKYIYRDTTVLENIWQIGKPVKAIFDSAYSANLALVTDTLNAYPVGNLSKFEFVVRSDDYTEVSFWHKYDTDSMEDGGVVEASINNGSNWTNILTSTAANFSFTNFYSATDTISSYSEQPGFTGNSGSWLKSTISWHPGPGPKTIRFRFAFSSDSLNTNKEGWMIDNLSVTTWLTGIDETMPYASINISPNPTVDFITIQMDNPGQFISAALTDIHGQIISTTDQMKLDLSNVKSGVYFVKVVTTKGTCQKQILKSN